MDKFDVLVQVTRMYYLRKMTHRQIADTLGCSRIKVTRLLKEAVDKGVVEFKVAAPSNDNLELEENLCSAFKLKRVVVTPSADDPDELYDLIGKGAARLLLESIKTGSVIGVGWGRTLNAMLPYLKPVEKSGCSVVSLSGGLSANRNQPNPYDVASAMAERLGVSAHYPLIPALINNNTARKALLSESQVEQILRMWAEVSICVISIGVLSPSTGLFYAFDNPESEVKKVRQSGGVGDILGRPFDINGAMLDVHFLSRLVTIEPATIKKSALSVGVAGGAEKVRAITGALRTGCINALVIDEETARKVLCLV